MERRVFVVMSAMALFGCDPREFLPELQGYSTVTSGQGGSRRDGGFVPETDGGFVIETDGGFVPETDGGFVPETDGGFVFETDGGFVFETDGGFVVTTDGGPGGAPCDLDRLMRPLADEGVFRVAWGTDATTAGLGPLASAMVGHWRGTRTTPWDGAHPVEFAFFGDGSYSAAGLDQKLPLYYGEHCADHRTWWRLDTGDEVQAAGELRITFDGSHTTTIEEIQQVRLSGDTLSFDQWHFQVYGPIHFELTRVP